MSSDNNDDDDDMDETVQSDADDMNESNIIVQVNSPTHSEQQMIEATTAVNDLQELPDAESVPIKRPASLPNCECSSSKNKGL